MKEYVITLIGTVIVCSLVIMLTPEDDKGIVGYVRLAAGLCVLCVSISPLSSFIAKLANIGRGELIFEGLVSDRENFEEIYEKNLMDAGGAELAQGLKSMLCREFGLNYDKIDVYVELYEGDDAYFLESVTVVMWRGGGTLLTDPHKVIEYVTSLLDCRCEIVYG